MALLTSSRGGRQYIWPSPDRSVQEKLWGVTTIINRGVPKDALKWWAARTTAEWAVDNLQTLQTMLRAPVVESYDPVPIGRVLELEREDGTVDAQKLALLIELARHEAADTEALGAAREVAVEITKGAHRRQTKQAALKGTHVHRAIEAYHLGKPYPGVPDIVRGQYDQFLRFLEEHRPVVEQTEANVYHRERKYAGTLDGIWVMPSLAGAIERAGLWEPTEQEPHPRVIVDVKTTGSGVYPEVGLQLNAYARAEFIGGPDGMEYPLPEIHAAAVLWLPAGGEYKLLPVRLGDDVFRAFLYAYEVLRWDEETSKDVVGQELPRPMLADPEAEYERLRDKSVEDLRRLAGARRLALVADVLESFDADELALAIVWDRETPEEVLRYRPEHPCPECGWEVEKVRHRNANTPKWRCTNDACEGGGPRKGGGNYPWGSWDTDPWTPKGQTSHLRPKENGSAPAAEKKTPAKKKKAAKVEDPPDAEQATLEVAEKSAE